MLIIVISAIVLVVGVVLLKCSNGYDSMFEYFGVPMVIFGGTIFLLSTVALPLERADDMAFIMEYESAKATIASDSFTEIERAALIQDIIKINMSIAKRKYWNETVFDVYIVDEAANLEPIL